jgi:D-alanyl-D-alanine carboxypeptidase
VTVDRPRRVTVRRLVAAVAVLVGGCSLPADIHPDPDGNVVTDGRPSSAGSTSVSRGRGSKPLDEYRSSVSRVGVELRGRMRFSHHAGCPVGWKDLRYLRLTYLDFDGETRTGELVVHKTFAAAVVGVFERLYEARWPIARMRLVDDYRGDDDRSMAANNTSGYNCRPVGGTHEWSAHAYGAAIDVNPVQNPYVTGTSTAPPAGSRFAAIDRSGSTPVPPGAIRAGDVVVRAFARIGWQWGGDWSTTKDFQHFSAAEDGRPLEMGS